MPSIDRHPLHTFCWAELATTDAARAKSFYSELFGWSNADAPMPDGTQYTTLSKGGRAVGGLFQMGSQFPKGTPTHWAVYVAVKDADATAKKVEQAGGKIIAPPFDVMEFGRMTTFADPTGALLSVWQPKSHPGFGVIREEGAPCWFELITTGAKQAKDFYANVFGWKFKESPEYSEIQVGNDSHGGVMEKRPEMGPMPPSWSVYFQVKSAGESTDRAKRLGAQVYVPPQNIADVGTFSVLADPTGGVFDLYESKPR